MLLSTWILLVDIKNKLSTVFKNELKLIAEPIKFDGEGEYNLNVLKEITVTDSYLGLDQEERGCQNEEPYDNCTTRQYHNTILEKCECLPFNMRVLSNEV